MYKIIITVSLLFLSEIKTSGMELGMDLDMGKESSQNRGILGDIRASSDSANQTDEEGKEAPLMGFEDDDAFEAVLLGEEKSPSLMQSFFSFTEKLKVVVPFIKSARNSMKDMYRMYVTVPELLDPQLATPSDSIKKYELTQRVERAIRSVDSIGNFEVGLQLAQVAVKKDLTLNPHIKEIIARFTLKQEALLMQRQNSADSQIQDAARQLQTLATMENKLGIDASK